MERTIKLAIILCYLCMSVYTSAATGGFGPSKEVNSLVVNMVNQIKSEVENDANANFPMFVPLRYREQIVAGTNYLVRVQTGASHFIDILFFKALPYRGEFLDYTGYRGDKAVNDPLVPF